MMFGSRRQRLSVLDFGLDFGFDFGYWMGSLYMLVITVDVGIENTSSLAHSEEKKLHCFTPIQHVTQDLLRKPNDALSSNACYHDWVRSERARLQIDGAVREWNDKLLVYRRRRPGVGIYHPIPYIWTSRAFYAESFINTGALLA